MRPRGQAPASGRFTDLVPALLILQQVIHPPTIVGEVGSKEDGAPRPHRHHKNHFDRARQGPSPSLGVPFLRLFFSICFIIIAPKRHPKTIRTWRGVAGVSQLWIGLCPHKPLTPQCPSHADPKMSILGCPSCRTRLRPMPLPVCCIPSFRGLGWMVTPQFCNSLVKWCFSKAPTHFSRVRKSTRKTSRAWPWPATVTWALVRLWWYLFLSHPPD